MWFTCCGEMISPPPNAHRSFLLIYRVQSPNYCLSLINCNCAWFRTKAYLWQDYPADSAKFVEIIYDYTMSILCVSSQAYDLRSGETREGQKWRSKTSEKKTLTDGNGSDTFVRGICLFWHMRETNDAKIAVPSRGYATRRSSRETFRGSGRVVCVKTFSQ